MTPINWRKECTETVAALQRSAIGALSFIWFGIDTPHVITMLPKNFQGLLPACQWIATALKPCEVVAIFIKQLATVVEVPDKWLSVRPCELRLEKNRWKRWNRVACMIHVTMDGLLLIPNSWKMLDLARWAGLVGATPFGLERIKEGFTIWASFCNVKAAAIEQKKADAIIQKYQKRLQGPLSALKQILDAKSLSPELIDEVNRLRAGKPPQVQKVKDEIALKEREREALRSKLASANPPRISQLTQEIDALEKNIAVKREKVARMEVWKRPQLDAWREVVLYKLKKCEVLIANADREKQKVTAGRWYDISKIVVLSFNNLLQLGVALIIAPHLGLSVATVAGLFFVGRWITSLTTGICCVGKTAAAIRFKDPLKLPQTYLIRA